MAPFVRELLAFFGGKPAREQGATAAGRVASSPQRDAPPQLVLGALKWLPRPSLRTLALAAAAAALYLALNHDKGPRRLAG